MNFYASVFENFKISHITRYGEGGPGLSGSVMTAPFELAGQKFMVINGGPEYKFNEAISVFVNCESQSEVDDLWSKLTTGGQTGRCGWLKDQFGLSWQIIPTALGELLGGSDNEKSQRVMQAMLQMDKIDTAALRHAAEL